MEEKEQSTWADMFKGWTKEQVSEFERHEEAAFRRGYFYGVDDTIEAVRAGVALQRLVTYYNGRLWKWRFGDCTKEVEPPEMPKVKVNADSHNDYTQVLASVCHC
jgi:hypothetical protein